MKRISMKKTLQSESWDRFLRQEAELGNDDAIEILKWMKKNRWLKSQRHLPQSGPVKQPKPNLKIYKPKNEV